MNGDKKNSITSNVPTFSPAQNRFLDALRATFGNVTAACTVTGTARATFYVWRKSPAFADAVADIEESNLDKAESALFELIESGNPTAIIFYLKTKGKKRGYTEKIDLDAVAPPSVTFVTTIRETGRTLATDD